MKKFLIILIFIVGIAMGMGAMYFYINPSEDNAESSLKGSEESLPVKKVDEDSSVAEIKSFLCYKYSLGDKNLSYFNNIEIDGEFHHAFYINDKHHAYESVLIYNGGTKDEFLYDPAGVIEEISEDYFDGITYLDSSNPPDPEVQEPVADDGWRIVFDDYMTALLYGKNIDVVNSYVDQSCFYIGDFNMQEYGRVKKSALKGMQKWIINSYKTFDASGVNYDVSYVEDDSNGSAVNEYVNGEGNQCVDIYIKIKTQYFVGNHSDTGYDRLFVSLMKYPDGWKITECCEPKM